MRPYVVAPMHLDQRLASVTLEQRVSPLAGKGRFSGDPHDDANGVELLFPFGHGLGWSSVGQLAVSTRVEVAPGETATARIELHRRSRQAWGAGAWMDEPGPVEVHIGRSSRDLRAVARAEA